MKKERRASQPASPERFIENATHGIPISLIKNIININLPLAMFYPNHSEQHQNLN